MKNFPAVIAMAVALSSCTWVQLTTEGEGVSLYTADRTANCQRIGRATAKTLGSIVTVERGGQRLQDELLTLARNEAGRMGGNVIVPESLIENGEQNYGVYNCPI
jgi:Domain of unknown function (DUF4156)